MMCMMFIFVQYVFDVEKLGAAWQQLFAIKTFTEESMNPAGWTVAFKAMNALDAKLCACL